MYLKCDLLAWIFSMSLEASRNSASVMMCGWNRPDSDWIPTTRARSGSTDLSGWSNGRMSIFFRRSFADFFGLFVELSSNSTCLGPTNKNLFCCSWWIHKLGQDLDWVKFRNLGKNSKDLWPFWGFFDPTWAYLLCYWQIFHFGKCPKTEKNI